MRYLEERTGEGQPAMPAPELPPDAAASPASRPRAPDRRARISSAGDRSGPAPRWDSAGTSLTMPRGIQYSGRIGPCETLTVEGVVQTQLDDCRNLAIPGRGVFRGTADVKTADISCTLQGSLRARGTLTVRASPRIVSESLSFAEFGIERGGRLTGAVWPLADDVGEASPARPSTRPRLTVDVHLPSPSGARLLRSAHQGSGVLWPVTLL